MAVLKLRDSKKSVYVRKWKPGKKISGVHEHVSDDRTKNGMAVVHGVGVLRPGDYVLYEGDGESAIIEVIKREDMAARFEDYHPGGVPRSGAAGRKAGGQGSKPGSQVAELPGAEKKAASKKRGGEGGTMPPGGGSSGEEGEGSVNRDQKISNTGSITPEGSKSTEGAKQPGGHEPEQDLGTGAGKPGGHEPEQDLGTGAGKPGGQEPEPGTDAGKPGGQEPEPGTDAGKPGGHEPDLGTGAGNPSNDLGTDAGKSAGPAKKKSTAAKKSPAKKKTKTPTPLGKKRSTKKSASKK